MATIPTGPGRARGRRVDGRPDARRRHERPGRRVRVRLLNLYVQAQALEMALFLERAGNSEEKMYEFFEEVHERLRAALTRALSQPERDQDALITAGDGDERFDVGLDVLINGLLDDPDGGPSHPDAAGLGARCERSIADPEARARARARRTVARVRELAAFEREAAAADALGQPGLEALELGDPLVDAARPGAREPRPVASRRGLVRREPRELVARSRRASGRPAVRRR